ncbi:hypothetical protein DYB28_002642 [Aphanomyces astaci]|uniref:H(+)-exporting diphosphatase n=1 Tax=Aphanomyces astaci TaxID=112090 RepID=A0A9X8E0S9_APHAT|nr:hypothetical protein DYB28_002642 [Aphanomyces astaci]
MDMSEFSSQMEKLSVDGELEDDIDLDLALPLGIEPFHRRRRHLVGKVDQGIAEDDLRKPAVIAELVGDIVGGCVGSSIDVFESVAAEIVGAMILVGSFAKEGALQSPVLFLFFPVVVHALDIVVYSNRHLVQDGKMRKASEIAEDADDSVEVAEVPVPQEEVVYLKAESDDVGTVQAVGTRGATKKARAADEAKAIATAAAKAADQAAKEAAIAATIGQWRYDWTPSQHCRRRGKQGNASVKRVAVRTQAKVKGEAGGPERTGLAPDEVFERELGFHWDRSRIFTPAGWGGVDLGYVRSMSGGSSFAMMRHCLSTL